MYKIIITLMFGLSVLVHADVLYEQANQASLAGDYAKAHTLMKKSAQKGNVYAQVNTGLMYEHGKGTDKNMEKARYWYEKASQQGDIKAPYNLGLIYEQGKGVKKDISKAVGYYQKAASSGSVDAQSHLAKLYYEGKGVKKDIPTGVYWYKMAADNGLASAQYALGVMLVNGQTGVALNKIVAFEYWMKAARQSHLEAQKSLDVLCKESPWACK